MKSSKLEFVNAVTMQWCILTAGIAVVEAFTDRQMINPIQLAVLVPMAVISVPAVRWIAKKRGKPAPI